MPKETIWGKESETDSPKINTQVTWNRDSYVQIATVVSDKPEDGSDGWYADLTRQNINDLIRTLRKARDQAFGKDE